MHREVNLMPYQFDLSESRPGIWIGKGKTWPLSCTVHGDYAGTAPNQGCQLCRCPCGKMLIREAKRRKHKCR